MGDERYQKITWQAGIKEKRPKGSPQQTWGRKVAVDFEGKRN